MSVPSFSLFQQVSIFFHRVWSQTDWDFLHWVVIICEDYLVKPVIKLFLTADFVLIVISHISASIAFAF